MTESEAEVEAEADSEAETAAPTDVRERVVGAVPLILVLALGVFMAAKEGGFAQTIWLPIGILMLAFAATIAIAVPRRLTGVPLPVVVTVGLMAALTAWSFASISWAQAKGDAWDGSNRTLLYLLVLSVVALWPTQPESVWVIIAGFVVAVGVLGVVSVVKLVDATDVGQFTITGRLSAPLGYPNANAAFFMLALWLAIGLASRPWLHWVVRGTSCGLAVILAGMSILAASRGSVFTLPAVVLTYLIIVPGRLRSLAMMAIIGTGVAPLVRPALAVYRSPTADIPGAARHALVLILVIGAVVASIGMIVAAVDDRTRLRPTLVRATGITAVFLAVATLAAAAVLTHPWSRLDTAWHQFRYAGEPAGTTHYGGLGSNRYDFWRVALREFRDHPVAGIGTDNFLVPYLRDRRSQEEPLYPHSLWVNLLSQGGLVAAALFAGFVGLASWAVRRIRRPRERELAGVAFVGFSVWLWHGLVDWLWEMPALGVVAMGLLGVALSLTRRTKSEPPRRQRIWVPVMCGICLVALGGTFAIPWFAERDVQRAAATWPNDANAAFRLLDRARSLNPATDRADVVAGAIASRLGRYELMRTRFSRATERAPYDWYAYLELGIANTLTEHRRSAAVAFRRAVALNPRETLVLEVIRDFRSGRRIDPAVVDKAFLESG